MNHGEAQVRAAVLLYQVAAGLRLRAAVFEAQAAMVEEYAAGLECGARGEAR